MYEDVCHVCERDPVTFTGILCDRCRVAMYGEDVDLVAEANVLAESSTMDV